MLELLWLIPALPFAGFLILALFGSRLSRQSAAVIGVGSVGLSAILTLGIAIRFISSPPADHAFSQMLWQWISVDAFQPAITLYLDALSLVFIFVITFVGFFIHLYSSLFMYEEEGYSRFFAYMNLFVGSMLTLVLGNNLLLLYLGWEGVGLCSYLLIGFWYKDSENGYAARKAFVVTRVGDTAMAIGLFLLFTSFGTLDIQKLLQQAPQEWTINSTQAVLAAALLLGGAVGKSAQLPLQTWLPDAMAGPTPVSALIHAATMVTAGVYLIARTHVLFTLAPAVQTAVAVVGALTLLMAGFTALTQRDIKRVLAYSTISQIGYMFLGLGVGAWSAAVFHFMTHAFFKALLFLGAGVIIFVLHHEHDMFKMGGLRKKLPVTFWTFLIGSASLAALPLITAGFYSKDMILWYTFAGEQGNDWLWAAGLAGAFITSIYTFRMVFVTFYGEAQAEITHKPGMQLKVPLIVLAVFSLIAGFIELPHTLGHLTLFSHFMHSALPPTEVLHESVSLELLLQVIAAIAVLLGIYIAYHIFIRNRSIANNLTASGPGALLHRFWYSGWGFDKVYDTLFVNPLVWFAKINRNDFIDLIYTGIAGTSREFHRQLTRTQTGRLRWYATGIVIGAIITITVVVYL
ncbi:MAG: NADH-quinone oxidoreductase subunit L [Caldithrix sp.]|nr:NADH-quinone oxidoreductase subunit L [Caldithrix sp.]